MPRRMRPRPVQGAGDAGQHDRAPIQRAPQQVPAPQKGREKKEIEQELRLRVRGLIDKVAERGDADEIRGR